ncbi:MAG: hypothetical protein FWD01_01835, partial [Defluviitaleaceae bacterium]|nr:hypothetical protein [Defluviitaleaceae bacterium]
DNIPVGNAIDNVPMLNILTIIGFVIMIIFTGYHFAKKQSLHIKKSLMAITSLVLLQIMNFFPHVFRFTESGNRILLLYAITFGLLVLALYSIYHIIIQIIFAEKQSPNAAKKYIFCVMTCCILYGLTFIPILQLRLPLYKGDNAIILVQAVLNFFGLH